jgi:hypothetical protein
VATKPPARHPWRIAIVAVGLLGVLNLGILIAANTDTSEPGTENLPSSVERVAPSPGDVTGLVTDVAADLAAGLTGVLLVDGACVPEDQLDVDPSLGTISFRPGPDKDLRRFEPGEHEVVVVYRDATDPEPANPCDASQEGLTAFRWRFRAAS